MADKIDMTPELTLDPSGAAAQAPAAPEAPTLTLETSVTPADAAGDAAALDLLPASGADYIKKDDLYHLHK